MFKFPPEVSHGCKRRKMPPGSNMPLGESIRVHNQAEKKNLLGFDSSSEPPAHPARAQNGSAGLCSCPGRNTACNLKRGCTCAFTLRRAEFSRGGSHAPRKGGLTRAVSAAMTLAAGARRVRATGECDFLFPSCVCAMLLHFMPSFLAQCVFISRSYVFKPRGGVKCQPPSGVT